MNGVINLKSQSPASILENLVLLSVVADLPFYFYFLNLDREFNVYSMKTTSEYLALLRVYMQKNAQKYGILRMGIFGSVARQEQQQDSDLDVYVEGDLHGFFALSGIKCELEELLGCRVDLVRLREKMDVFLREKIRKEGISV